MLHGPHRSILSVPALVVVVLFACLAAPPAALADDPAQEWRTLVTPHFYVHYYRNERADEAELAQKVARAAEAAHAKLSPILGHSPSGRTHIVLTDDTDGANGSAQIIPMNIVRLYATGPSSISGMNDYDDWMYSLIVHEYTHILHIDTIHGIARVVNAVLGKTWAPNQIQPKWFIEGLAVYNESARTTGGRNRSAIYDMYLRAAVLEGKLLDLDQVSSSTRYYPRGTVPYLYGSRFVKYIADRFGEEKLTRISHDYGGQPLPYAINRSAKRVLGYTFAELYESFRDHLRRGYALQAARVKARGVTPARQVTHYGEACGSPRYSLDGKELVFIDTDGRSQFAVKVLDVATGNISESFDIYGGNGVGFTPDRQHLVYAQSAPWRTFYSYHDVFVRHRATGKERRLTSGLRARDPAVSPDGRQVAFVTSELGTMSLAVIPLEGGQHRVLYQGRDGDQVFAPRWSPDGKRLTYSRWRKGGHRDIYVMDLDTGEHRNLTDDRALDLDPVFSGDGRRIYFSSDRTGIFNLYCLELDSGDLRQVSNLLHGAFVPAVSPDEKHAYFVGFTTNGFDLFAMDLDREAYKPALPYVSDRPAPVNLPASPTYEDEPYAPLTSLLPRAWTFRYGVDAYGSTLGFEVSGADVALHHSYLLAANFSLEHGRPSYALSYAYNRLWPSLRLDTSRFEGPRGGLVLDGKGVPYVEENYGAGASVGLPVVRIRGHYGSISVGYRFNWFRDMDQTEVLVMPDELSPRLPATGILSGLTAGLSYSNVERYAHSISPERGRAINVGLRADLHALGSDFQATQVNWSWTEYIALPWLQDHVLALRYGGGISAGDTQRRGAFGLGGFRDQDVLLTLLDISRPGGVYLRGYPPGAVYGDQFHLVNAEYRMPIYDVERGLSSLPVYLNHLHMAVFVDVGNAFYDDFLPEELKVGVGAELLIEGVIGYVIPTTLRVGYARGLMEPGGNQFHVQVGRPF